MTVNRDPKILEIGEFRLMREAYPETTEHWSTTPAEHFVSDGPSERRVTFSSLPQLARVLATPGAYDLIVVQPGAFRPWHTQAISRAVFRRSALRGSIAYARYFGQDMIRGTVHAPIAIWDQEDAPTIARHNVFLLDRAQLYFKRELPPDHWRVFMGTLHRNLPTRRFRDRPKNRERIDKLRPIGLGLPLHRDRLAAAHPVSDADKTADIFFTGRVVGSSSVRASGLPELLALRDKGYRIDIPDNNLPLNDFLQRCARAWITWSPEGYGYECFRTYEAAICGSVPVLNRSTVHGYKPLRDGEHCFYYDVEPGGLTRTLEAALADRARLSRMAEAARGFVLAEHTHAALARHIAETTLMAASQHGQFPAIWS